VEYISLLLLLALFLVGIFSCLSNKMSMAPLWAMAALNIGLQRGLGFMVLLIGSTLPLLVIRPSLERNTKPTSILEKILIYLTLSSIFGVLFVYSQRIEAFLRLETNVKASLAEYLLLGVCIVGSIFKKRRTV